jgi:riboflavin synthase
MFTGIVETTGNIRNIVEEGTNRIFTIEVPFGSEMKANDSLSHNGVCLTVTGTKGNEYNVTAVKETLEKSNLGELQVGDIVNLERAMSSGYRFDGQSIKPVGAPTRKKLTAVGCSTLNLIRVRRETS